MKLLEKRGIVKYDVDLQAKVGAWVTGTKGYFLLDEKSQISNLTVEYRGNPKARSEKIKIEVFACEIPASDKLSDPFYIGKSKQWLVPDRQTVRRAIDRGALSLSKQEVHGLLAIGTRR